MKIFFDTEFIEDGKTIDLISIGMVREDGKELYLENMDCDLTQANGWVCKNVLPYLHRCKVPHGPAKTQMGDGEYEWIEELGSEDPSVVPKWQIANRVRAFVGPNPEFWAYFADYDWVVLCQLYGRMIDLPDGWPMFCCDVQQQYYLSEKYKDVTRDLPQMTGTAHNALHDARWCKEVYEWLQS